MATQIFAVTGNPILHSKSPAMFNTMFAEAGLDAVYLHCMAERAEDALFLFKSMNMRGMNVTSPFKETIGTMLDVVHDEAEILGSVNTIVNKDGVLHGYNTDFYGVIQSFVDSGISLQGKNCIVIGAGGAGKAAAYGLHISGAHVVIVNRTIEKARRAAELIGCSYAPLSDLKEVLDKSDILLSALQQNVNPVDEQWLQAHHIIFDANYKGSSLIAMAQRKGCTIVSAEDWLLNQAVASYEFFLGNKPNKELMRRGLTLPTFADRKHVISTIGIMGAGKTSHGKLLAQKLTYAFKDVDDEIVAKEQRPITEIFASDGEPYFRSVEKEMLSQLCGSGKATVLSCGGGIVLNGPNRELLKQESIVLWLYAQPETIIGRTNISKRPLLQVADPKAKLESLLQERRDFYAKTAHVVCSTEINNKNRTTDLIQQEFEKIWGVQ